MYNQNHITCRCTCVWTYKHWTHNTDIQIYAHTKNDYLDIQLCYFVNVIIYSYTRSMMYLFTDDILINFYTSMFTYTLLYCVYYIVYRILSMLYSLYNILYTIYHILKTLQHMPYCVLYTIYFIRCISYHKLYAI